MDADVHVAWNFGNAIIVEIDILLEQFIGRVGVLRVLLPALQHGFGAEICEIWVVKLDVAEAVVVENLKLCLICFGNVGKVFIIGRVYIAWVRLTLLVAKVVPIWCRKRQLEIPDLVLGHKALEEIKLVRICAALVLDLARTDDGLPWLIARFREGGDVWYIHSEDRRVGLGDFSHALEAWPERPPEHVSSVLAVGNSMEAQIELCLHNVLDILVFCFRQSISRLFASFPGMTGV